MWVEELIGSVVLSVLQETHIMDTIHTEPADGTTDTPATASLPQVVAYQAADRQEMADEELTASDTLLMSSFRGEETVPAPKLIRRLLVPLDGTPEAERTLPYASRLARLLHAHLILGHVTPTADASRLAQAFHLPGSDRLTTQQAFEPRALPYLQYLRWRLSVPPKQVKTHHFSAPSVVDGLLELVAADHIDLVIVGL